jgi:hypothetical protein
MSYGVYSEVYFAVDFSDDTRIKIGETTNARRRGSQLANEGYTIVATRDVNGDEVARLFVESFVRARIEATQRVQRIGYDHFVCDNKDIKIMLFRKFDEWVTQAQSILNFIKQNNGEIFFNIDNSKPAIPLGEEPLYRKIFESLDEKGIWEDCVQLKYKDSEEKLNNFKRAFSPFNYKCSMTTNCSWTYFKIEKI